MKKLVITFFAAILLIFTACTCSKKETDEAQLLFEDNFDGSVIDASKWQKCPEVERQGASEWNDDNSYVENGNLVLKITPHATKQNYVYTGAVRTRGIYERAYGYFEARIKFPVCSGTWGAFWLMYSSGTVNNSGKDGTEVDIIESIKNQEGMANSALHWDGYGDGHKSDGMSYPGIDIYNGEFHTFALDWTKDVYVFYIDGVEKWRTSAGGVCEVPLYIKLTAEAAPWAGTINFEELPKYVLVDYVRVFSRKPDPLNVKNP